MNQLSSSVMFQCDDCFAIIKDESAFWNHLSTLHFDYYPYRCGYCAETGEIHSTTTEDKMKHHLETIHRVNDLKISIHKKHDIEIQIRAIVDKCRLRSENSTAVLENVLRQAYDVLDEGSESSIRSRDHRVATSPLPKQRESSVEASETSIDDAIEAADPLPRLKLEEAFSVNELLQNCYNTLSDGTKKETDSEDSDQAHHAIPNANVENEDPAPEVNVDEPEEDQDSDAEHLNTGDGNDNEAEESRPTTSNRRRFAENEKKKFIRLVARAKALMQYEQINPRKHARTGESGVNKFYGFVMAKCGIKSKDAFNARMTRNKQAIAALVPQKVAELRRKRGFQPQLTQRVPDGMMAFLRAHLDVIREWFAGKSASAGKVTIEHWNAELIPRLRQLPGAPSNLTGENRYGATNIRYQKLWRTRYITKKLPCPTGTPVGRGGRVTLSGGIEGTDGTATLGIPGRRDTPGTLGAAQVKHTRAAMKAETERTLDEANIFGIWIGLESWE